MEEQKYLIGDKKFRRDDFLKFFFNHKKLESILEFSIVSVCENDEKGEYDIVVELNYEPSFFKRKLQIPYYLTSKKMPFPKFTPVCKDTYKTKLIL